MSKFKLPKMQCDDGCGGCCGVVPVTEKEFEVVIKYILENEITPIDNGVNCPLYMNGKCSIYPVRPLLCKLFGHTDAMKCPRGYNVNVPPRKLRKLIEKQGQCKKVLHQILIAEGIRNDINHIIGAVGGYIEKEDEKVKDVATVVTMAGVLNAKK